MKKYACLMIGLLGLGSASLALAATQVYKWTDANGQVHYSESPPADASTKTTTLNIHAQPADSDGTPPPTPAAAPAASGKTQTATKPKVDPEKAKAEKEQACNEWKDDLTNLTTHGRIRVMGDDGNVTALSDDDKQARQKADQDSIDKYCSN